MNNAQAQVPEPSTNEPITQHVLVDMPAMLHALVEEAMRNGELQIEVESIDEDENGSPTEHNVIFDINDILNNDFYV